MVQEDALTPHKRYELITRGIEEVIGGDLIQKIYFPLYKIFLYSP